jgi:hypothetical protein
MFSNHWPLASAEQIVRQVVREKAGRGGSRKEVGMCGSQSSHSGILKGDATRISLVGRPSASPPPERGDANLSPVSMTQRSRGGRRGDGLAGAGVLQVAVVLWTRTGKKLREGLEGSLSEDISVWGGVQHWQARRQAREVRLTRDIRSALAGASSSHSKPQRFLAVRLIYCQNRTMM